MSNNYLNKDEMFSLGLNSNKKTNQENSLKEVTKSDLFKSPIEMVEGGALLKTGIDAFNKAKGALIAAEEAEIVTIGVGLEVAGGMSGGIVTATVGAIIAIKASIEYLFRDRNIEIDKDRETVKGVDFDKDSVSNFADRSFGERSEKGSGMGSLADGRSLGEKPERDRSFA